VPSADALKFIAYNAQHVAPAAVVESSKHCVELFALIHLVVSLPIQQYFLFATTVYPHSGEI
jgi:hypothetical protein